MLYRSTAPLRTLPRCHASSWIVHLPRKLRWKHSAGRGMVHDVELAGHRRMPHVRSTNTDDAVQGDDAVVFEPDVVISPVATTSPPQKGNAPWQIILALCTAAIFICYADRSNISVAVLSMAEQFGWGDSFKGTVLSVFFLGYSCTQLIGGSWADKYGGKTVLAAGVIAWSTFTFVTPDAAMMGSTALIACRIGMGLGEGVAFPAVHSIIATSVPLGFQSTSVALVTAASYAGAGLAAGVSPWLINKYSWPMVFYVFGASAVLWLPLWLITSVPSQKLSPPSSPAPAEIDDLEGDGVSLLRPTRGGRQTSSPGFLGLDAGFWALAKRKEVWAICVAQYCQSWGMYALLNWLPAYFQEVQHVDISDLGTYTLVPPLAQALVGAFSGVLADRLLVTGWSVRGTRRSLQVAGMLGPAACLLLAVSPATDGSPGTASALVTAAQGFSALTLGAVSVSQLDIAPKHAGSIFGLGNTFATVAGLLSVQVTGNILEATHSWPVVFAVTSAHYVVGAAFWFAWVGGELLPEDDLA